MRARISDRSRLILLAAFFLFVALGSFTWPGGIIFYSGRGDGSAMLVVLKLAAWLYIACSLVPPALVLGAAVSPLVAQSQPYFRTATVLLGICVFVALAGFPVVFGYSALVSTPEFMAVNLARVAVLLLQVVICHEFLLQITGGDHFALGGVLIVILLPVFAFCFWSLASGVVAAFQMSTVAAGGPYCIGDTAHPGDPYGEIDSVFGLRGVDLVVSITGYKHNSYWFYHAVMIAPDNDESAYWNWSVRQMAFTPISERTQRLLNHPVDRACQPKVNFISWLLWPF